MKLNKVTQEFFTCLLCSCLLLFLSSCGADHNEYPVYSDYEEGYDLGKSVGFKRGYESGYDEGYSAGCNDSEGLAIDSYTDGYREGYSDGNMDGYYAGATYTCIFFKDIDRAFQVAITEYSWDAFIDAYDEYVYDIYKSSEERSELFWALMSASDDSGFTEDERDLLILKFGENLFVKNGVDIHKRKAE